ncbi:PucR family transcriptional regulator [Modestobacter sp. VKM Ac-2984]|uniref:PucR family transcriptional regulator n=1 Tax=Modestobacter sp. VKM Ac-2984 TaxID=3004138 RepID=UPI0022AABD04|nr:helix-turn-helix domain-containing protein [Modestobacter sp. VKM Ac-2984]MCZ2815999.1 helix-turn-helix domain-containing protein [Modestobacter sp. VKM Ac-2984]
MTPFMAESPLVRLLPALLAGVPDMLAGVTRALAEVDQGYADFLARGRAEAVPSAELAIRRLVWGAEQASRPDRSGAAAPPPDGRRAEGPPGDEEIWSLFGELGREQRRCDLPVGDLLSAYQAGGRAAWRHIAATAVAGRLPAAALAALAEELFSLVDHLGAVTIAGYVAEQVGAADLREELRDALAERLLSDRADGGAVEVAARRANWPLPAGAAVVFVQPDDHAGRQSLARLGSDCLQLRRTPLPGAIVPDLAAPGRRKRLEAALRGCTALVGPVVELRRLPESARLAEAAVRTLPPRRPEDGPVFVDEHLDTLIVHRDPELLEALRQQVLRPLAEAAPASQEALRQTLRSWLTHMGNRRAVADELGIHPQTVRYRLGRLQELFGPALEDPAGRLQMLLALAWEPTCPDTPRRSAPPAGTARRTAAARRTRPSAAGDPPVVPVLRSGRTGPDAGPVAAPAPPRRAGSAR